MEPDSSTIKITSLNIGAAFREAANKLEQTAMAENIFLYCMTNLIKNIKNNCIIGTLN
ncbi:hypothetical protein NSMM_370140 [Nitrosomonas mobilis]|uniref:Uncharacterized protein n=1 Tax=Nitrosomonas mobilis TaxID=51642 RepID=A0A1G5SFN0_9PROT|nr:hypothetical protein NSMM_370140 [Nitrosomonas mobilis]